MNEEGLHLYEIAYGHPTTFRRNTDRYKAFRRNSVSIFQSRTAIKRSYLFVGNGHLVRRKFVGKYRRNTDDRNGYIFSSAYRRKFDGIFRRLFDDYNGYIVYRNIVEKSSEYSDDPCFLGNSSELADGIPTTSDFLFSSEIGQNSVQSVRRLCRPSESPSEFGVFSCSV